MKRLISTVVILLLVVGCATQGQQAKTEGAAAGAGIGSLTGGLIGVLMKKDKNAALVGAGIGAIVGGVLGYQYAARIDRHRQELAGKENDLDARIKFAHNINQDTKAYNRRIEDKLNKLTAKVEKQQLSRQELAKEKKALALTAQEANEQLSLAQNDLRGLKDFQHQQIKQRQRSEELDREIAKMEANLAQLKRNTSSLAALSQRI